MTRGVFVLATVAGALVATRTPLLGQEGRPAERAAVACSVADVQRAAPAGTTVTAATDVPPTASQPRHCQVDGYVAAPGNAVNFRVALPQNWNQKFLFIGVGGLGGQFGQLGPGLARGYATATTDTGHLASDPDWGKHRAKELDYGHRGTHVTTVAAKALTTAFYSRPVRKAYFNGCSNGGRQALMEVQRYPDDYDGIIAGHPATGTPMQAGRALVFQKLLASAESYLPAETVTRLSAATLAACDKSDGLEDGLVSNPVRCTFNPESLRCTSANDTGCLNAKQLDVVKQIYDGARTSDGQLYTYGFPFGHEGDPTGWQAWITGSVPPTRQPDGSLAFGSNPPLGFRFSEANMRMLSTEDDDPSLTWRTLNLARDLARMRVMSEMLSPVDPDLRPFKARGGKLVLYHGWADPAISALGTIDYWNKVAQAVGSPAARDEFVALYLVPGMHHCSGGPGPNEFDILTVLEDWAEQGVAPGRIIATHRSEGRVDRTRPLCPHPQVAAYVGSGSIDDSASFRCAAP